MNVMCIYVGIEKLLHYFRKIFTKNRDLSAPTTMEPRQTTTSDHIHILKLPSVHYSLQLGYLSNNYK